MAYGGELSVISLAILRIRTVVFVLVSYLNFCVEHVTTLYLIYWVPAQLSEAIFPEVDFRQIRICESQFPK